MINEYVVVAQLSITSDRLKSMFSEFFLYFTSFLSPTPIEIMGFEANNSGSLNCTLFGF